MTRFSLIDHFLVSGTLFSYAVSSAYVLHDVDNTSDHDPIALQLDLKVEFVKFANKMHIPSSS